MESLIMYDREGGIYNILQEVQGGYLAAAVYEGDYESDPQFVRKGDLTDKAPTQQLSEDVSALKKEVEELHRQRIELNKLLRDEQKNAENKLKHYSKYRTLKTLDDFIAGKITHYISDNGYSGLVIRPFVKGKDEPGGYEFDSDRDAFKLLSLFGRSNGDLEWKISQYKDGSGGWDTVRLATSYEHAIEMMHELIEQEIQSKGLSDRTIMAAKQYGYEISKEAYEAHAEKQRDSIRRQIEHHEKQIESYTAQLALLNGDL